jgi:TonB family protein
MKRNSLTLIAALLALASSTSPAQQAAGLWRIEETASKPDGESIVVLTLPATSTVLDNSSVASTRLLVRCSQNKLDASVDFAAVLGRDTSAVVRIRWDAGRPVEESWSRSPDRRAMVSPDPIGLIVGMVQHTQLTIETHPADQTTVIASFTLHGLTDLTPRLSRACPGAGLSARVNAVRVLYDFQVERPAIADTNNVPPTYPNDLRASKREGQVVAKFVVDTTGRADMSTFEVMKSDHPLFSEAVWKALPGYRFHPAELGGRKVKQLVQMPFNFTVR